MKDVSIYWLKGTLFICPVGYELKVGDKCKGEDGVGRVKTVVTKKYNELHALTLMRVLGLQNFSKLVDRMRSLFGPTYKHKSYLIVEVELVE